MSLDFDPSFHSHGNAVVFLTTLLFLSTGSARIVNCTRVLNFHMSCLTNKRQAMVIKRCCANVAYLKYLKHSLHVKFTCSFTLCTLRLFL